MAVPGFMSQQIDCFAIKPHQDLTQTLNSAVLQKPRLWLQNRRDNHIPILQPYKLFPWSTAQQGTADAQTHSNHLSLKPSFEAVRRIFVI